MVRLLFVLLTALPFFFTAISLSGIDEKRFKLLMEALDTAFDDAGFLTHKERAAALNMDASQYSLMRSGDKPLPMHKVVAVQNVTFLTSFFSGCLYGFVKLTALEIASDVASDFKRRA